MKLLIQRVKNATITINNNPKDKSKIHQGVIVYIGIHNSDTSQTIQKATERILNLSIFEDNNNKLKQSLQDIKGDILLIPNFTLYGRNKKGNQLDFTDAGSFKASKNTYKTLISTLKKEYKSGKIQTGLFGSYMEVESTVDGPVNVIIEL